jgi:hypothetical protein
VWLVVRMFEYVGIVGRRRLSNPWMMNAGFTWGTGTKDFDGTNGVFDPTNVEIRNAEQVAPYTDGSGKTRIFMNSNWVLRLDGMVQLPADVNIAGKLNGRQGFPLFQSYRTPPRAGGIGRTEVLLDPVGDVRLESLWVADLRVEKALRWNRTEISGMFDIFNLLNEGTVLKRENRQNLSTLNEIQELLPPRVFRFGVRVRF